MTDNTTGSSGPGIRTGTGTGFDEGERTSNVVSLNSYGDLSSYRNDAYRTWETSGSFEAGGERRTRRKPQRVSAASGGDLQKRHAIRVALNALSDASSQLSDVSLEDDQMAKAVLCYQIQDKLAELWAMRGYREEGFTDAVNLMQSSMRNAVFEAWPATTCKAVSRYLLEVMCLPNIDDAALARAMELLNDANLDAWAGLSAVDDAPKNIP